jgi:hypothetical protein
VSPVTRNVIFEISCRTRFANLSTSLFQLSTLFDRLLFPVLSIDSTRTDHVAVTGLRFISKGVTFTSIKKFAYHEGRQTASGKAPIALLQLG